MSNHIDLFEKICGQIASSGKPATEEETLDWFLEGVHEDTYASIKAHCNSLKIQGTLQFSQMINKLYALTCFAKYPQFQLRALGHKDAPLTNNSFTLVKRGRKGKGKPDKGKGRGREPSNTGKGKGGRGKGKGQNHTQGKKGRGWNKPHDGAPSHTQQDSKHKGKVHHNTAKPFQGECS
jgi:hypothetical protein